MKEVGLREACVLANRSQERMRTLLREGKVKGRKLDLGGNGVDRWAIDVESLHQYLAPNFSATRSEEIRALHQEVQALLEAVKELQRSLPRK